MSTGIPVSLMMCAGLRSAPLCWLDILTRCKVPMICQAHDRSVDRYYNRAEKRRAEQEGQHG